VSRSSNRIRLVLASSVLAVVALTGALAVAQTQHEPEPQEHGNAADHAAPAVHTGAEAAAQSGEHRSEPAHEGEHAAAGGHHGPEAINWTDIWDKRRPAIDALVINFGVLLTLYYMLGKKPIANALKQRRVTIGKDIDEAQKLLDEAKERAKKYQGDLKNADVDAASAKAALIASGTGEVEHLLVEAQERADRMTRDAERLVEQERKQLHLDLMNETIELAVVEASQILAKSVTADDHARLAHDLLAELARRPAAKSTAASGGGAS
jgi:F-type H+-transporting ATPase subunit b